MKKLLMLFLVATLTVPSAVTLQAKTKDQGDYTDDEAYGDYGYNYDDEEDKEGEKEKEKEDDEDAYGNYGYDYDDDDDAVNESVGQGDNSDEDAYGNYGYDYDDDEAEGTVDESENTEEEDAYGDYGYDYEDEKTTSKVSVPVPVIKKVERKSSNSYTVKYDSKKAKASFIKICTKAGKEVVNTASKTNPYTFSKVKPGVYSVEMRNRNKKDGKYHYSRWTEKVWFITDPVIDTKYAQKNTKAKSTVLKWDEVPGATSYIVYISSKSDSGYTKVGTTKKTTYSVTKPNNKKISFKSKKYFKVKAVTSAGGKTIKSDGANAISVIAK